MILVTLSSETKNCGYILVRDKTAEQVRLFDNLQTIFVMSHFHLREYLTSFATSILPSLNDTCNSGL